MSECILCQVRRPEKPFYIESVGLNLYSVEELIYFITQNLPMLDTALVNEELIRWIKEELRLKRLAQNLTILLKQEFRRKDILLLMFREVGYPDTSMMKRALEELEQLEAQPIHEKIKRKGDVLIRHQRYLKAIEVYRSVLDQKNAADFGAQYMGILYNNIGYAYAKMFQLEEAVSYFKQSNELIRSRASLKSYLYAVYLKDGEAVYRKLSEAFRLDPDTAAEMDRELAELKMPQIPSKPEEAVEEWVKAYHRSCEAK